MTRALQVRPDPLPDTSDELVARRPSALVDRVRHLMLNGAYGPMRPYLNTTSEEDSVQGSIQMDRAGAAIELQKFAKQHGDELVATLNWKEADRLINRVMRQHGIARNQRIKQAMQMTLPTVDEQPVADNG